MNPISASLPARLWFRGRFYLSGLVLVLPAMAFPFYFQQVSAPPLGAHILPERQVGPYVVTLAEFMPGPPHPGEDGHPVKDFSLHVRDGYPQRIRSVYLRLGAPAHADDLGEAMHGNPYRLHVHVPIPAQVSAAERLWLTIEDWDGTLRQTWWPVTEATTRMILTPDKKE